MVKILKSKWYITIRQWPPESVRQVLPQHGAFPTQMEAIKFMYQPGTNHLLEKYRKPGFEKGLPVKGEKILRHPQLYLVPEKCSTRSSDRVRIETRLRQRVKDFEAWSDWAWNFIADMRGLRKFGDHDSLALEILKQHPKHGE